MILRSTRLIHAENDVERTVLESEKCRYISIIERLNQSRAAAGERRTGVAVAKLIGNKLLCLSLALAAFAVV